MTVHDFARRLGVILGASALLGAGAGTPDSMGALDVALNLAGSAQANAPVRSDDVRSFRMTYTSKREGRMVIIHEEDRNADKSTTARDMSAIYRIGMTTYFQINGGQWVKFDAARYERAQAKSSKPAVAARTPRARTERFVQLPDRRVNGVLLGAVSITQRGSTFDQQVHASQHVTTTCLYEKTTGRLRSCRAPGLYTVTFDRYNDPSNRVEVPVAALGAPDAFPIAEVTPLPHGLKELCR